MKEYYYLGFRYRAVAPQPDTNDLVEKGERLLVRHNLGHSPTFVVAEKGVPYAGWVIGVFEEPIDYDLLNRRRLHASC